MKRFFRKTGLLLSLIAAAGLSQAQKAYFQQEVNYTISVTLDDQAHTLTATEEMEYINNSPDQLTFIWFHLWPNAYKNNTTAFAKQQALNKETQFHFAAKSKRGNIDGLKFQVNGKNAFLDFDPKNPDIAKLVLPEPLAPGGKAIITTPFKVKLPDSFSRMGHVGQSYQITQWYPKPAVYDHKGWHQMPYLDQGEFYSEFGSFDVSITLPKNYVVGATGELQNMDEQAFLDQKAAEAAAKTTFSKDLNFPPSAPDTKTLRYKQSKVHDFAWFADKRWEVLKGEVNLPESGRKVTTWLMFLPDKGEEWSTKGQVDIRDAVYHYSKMVGEYPYSAVTAVDGALSAGSGMEYPMITVTDRGAIIHEVGHNWFYGILGSNERDHAWQDEGINTFVEKRVQAAQSPGGGTSFNIQINGKSLGNMLGLNAEEAKSMDLLPYQVTASRGLDQQINQPSDRFTSFNYGIDVYYRTAGLFSYLRQYLSEARFDEAMHAYFEEWKFRHPYPEDLQASFEKSSGEKLDWFFKDILSTDREIDIRLANVEVTAVETIVTLKNESGIEAAVPVGLLDSEGNTLETVWSKPFKGRTTVNLPANPQTVKVQVDPQSLVPEVDKRDNQMRIKGILRKVESLKIQPLLGLETPRRNRLYFMPTVGWNTNDKWMAGMALYNHSLIQKKLSYLVMPMYSFSQSELNGIGKVSLNLFPRNVFKGLEVSMLGQKFERYTKLQPAVTFTFPRTLRTSPGFEVGYTFTDIELNSRTQRTFPETTFDYAFSNSLPTTYQAHTLHYRIGKKDAISSYQATLMARRYVSQRLETDGDNTNTLAQMELQFSRATTEKDNLKVRFFGAQFLGRSDTNPFPLFMSGSADYLKDHLFLDRSQNSSFIKGFEHQTDLADGGFKSWLPDVQSTNWMAAVNLTADVPAVPLIFFADFGATALPKNKLQTADTETHFFYDAGLGISIANGFLEVYCPLLGSSYEKYGEEVRSFPESAREFRDNIRFSLQLNRLNPFKLVTENLQ